MPVMFSKAESVSAKHHTLALSKAGGKNLVACFGNNGYGQCNIETDKNVSDGNLDVKAGVSKSC